MSEHEHAVREGGGDRRWDDPVLGPDSRVEDPSLPSGEEVRVRSQAWALTHRLLPILVIAACLVGAVASASTGTYNGAWFLCVGGFVVASHVLIRSS